MSVTAVITVTPSSATPEQVVTIKTAVTNGGANAILVKGITPTICPSGGTPGGCAGTVDPPLVIPGNNQSIAAGATANYFSKGVGFVPLQGKTSGSQAYTIGANVLTSDAAVAIVATTATLTVAP